MMVRVPQSGNFVPVKGSELSFPFVVLTSSRQLQIADWQGRDPQTTELIVLVDSPITDGSKVSVTLPFPHQVGPDPSPFNPGTSIRIQKANNNSFGVEVIASGGALLTGSMGAQGVSWSSYYAPDESNPPAAWSSCWVYQGNGLWGPKGGIPAGQSGAGQYGGGVFPSMLYHGGAATGTATVVLGARHVEGEDQVYPIFQRLSSMWSYQGDFEDVPAGESRSIDVPLSGSGTALQLGRYALIRACVAASDDQLPTAECYGFVYDLIVKSVGGGTPSVIVATDPILEDGAPDVSVAFSIVGTALEPILRAELTNALGAPITACRLYYSEQSVG